MCAFRGPEVFSTVFGQFEYVESDVLGVIIPKRWVRAQRAREVCARAHNANFASEGRRPLKQVLKMTAIIDLVGIEQKIKALDPLVFEILTKTCFSESPVSKI